MLDLRFERKRGGPDKEDKDYDKRRVGGFYDPRAEVGDSAEERKAEGQYSWLGVDCEGYRAERDQDLHWFWSMHEATLHCLEQ